MSHLKSAPGFPLHPSPSSSTSHPVPRPQRPPPSPPHPVLTSRFSAETLVIKSPPTRTFQRLFHTSNSPPSSPSPRRSYSFSASSPKLKLSHSPSASESRINISSPNAYDTDAVDPCGRASLDEAEVLRSPTMARPRERGRIMSGAAAGGAIGAGKDKLAGAAKEVLEMISRRKVPGYMHGRKDSVSSAQTIGSSTGRTSRSMSSPAPPHADLGPAPPPRPTRRPVSPPHPSVELDRSVTGYKLVDLPPRSDSRNAFVATTLAPKIPTRAPPLPPCSSNAPLVKGPATMRRPHSPPSVSIPPLHPRPRPAAPEAPPHAANPSLPPFKALLLSEPSLLAVCTKRPHELLVKLDIGGREHITTVETLVTSGKGGKLGEFVEGVLEEARRKKEGYDEDDSLYPPSITTRMEQAPLLNVTFGDEDDEASSLSITPSHFDVSPYASPFPFMRYSDSTDHGALSSPLPSQEQDGCDPTSPIDPFAKKLFHAIPSLDFAPPPPPLKLELCVPTSSATKATPQQARLVASPSMPHAKHLSVHPDILTTSPPPPSSPVPPLPTDSTRPVSTASTASSLSFSHGLDLPICIPDDEGPISPTELAARRALAARLHLSRHSFSDELNPFEAALGPFFEVLRHQAHAPLSSGGSASSSDESNVLELAHELPLDWDATTPEEDRSRSTLLGVPRGSVRLPSGRRRRAAQGEDGDQVVPEVPMLSVEVEPEAAKKVVVDDGDEHSRPPSLSMSATTLPTDSESPSHRPSHRCRSLDVESSSTMHIFLDRTDGALGNNSGDTTYSAVLSFLRDGALPSSLVLPLSSSPSIPTTQPNVDETYLSLLALQPSLVFQQLAALRTLQKEAEYLGMGALGKAVEVERGRWVEVVIWLEEGRGTGEGGRHERGADEQTRNKRRELMRGREKAGWI
ncbi:hypothetical protein JCM1840_002650 [Sporobolomyces johnsonii]